MLFLHFSLNQSSLNFIFNLQTIKKHRKEDVSIKNIFFILINVKFFERGEFQISLFLVYLDEVCNARKDIKIFIF